MGEEALFGAGFFFVTAGAAQSGFEVELFQGVEEGDRLQAVPAGVGAGLFDDPPLVDRVLDVPDDEAGADLFHVFVSKVDRLFEVVAGVDVQKGEWDLGREERFAGQVGHGDRVFAA